MSTSVDEPTADQQVVGMQGKHDESTALLGGSSGMPKRQFEQTFPDSSFAKTEDNPYKTQPSTEAISHGAKKVKENCSDDVISTNHSLISKTSSYEIIYTDKGEIIDTREPKIDVILSHRFEPDQSIYFLVKYDGKSYRDKTWIPEPKGAQAQKKINHYQAKYPINPPQEPLYPPEYDIPHSILSHRFVDGEEEFLVMWTDLERKDATWETRESLKNEHLIEEFFRVPTQDELKNEPKKNSSEWMEITVTPKSKTGKELRDYQVAGLNFLARSWYFNNNAILADEIGLGKATQVCSFLNFLNKNEHQYGPFLVVVPMGVIEQWRKEIEDWTELKLLLLHGTKQERQEIMDNEIKYENTSILRFQVLLTTSDSIIKNQSFFSEINWVAMIYCESHGLKAQFTKSLNAFGECHSSFNLLISDMPLTNNINELLAISSFIGPEKSPSSNASFLNLPTDLSEKDRITQLQNILKAFMIRRMKEDVEKKYSPLEEIIIECNLTSYQKFFYKAVFMKNQEMLCQGVQRRVTNLKNISVELRKVCNHPFLISDAEDNIIEERMVKLAVSERTSDFESETMIQACGKMIILDKLLQSMKKDGHKVLIFSQMPKILDILQDMLVFRGYNFYCLDGSLRGKERQEMINSFNSNPDMFICLLNTRTCNFGIDLSSADRYIVYDSDWSPTQIQLIASCHKIGDQKDVKMYLLIAKNTYERAMVDYYSNKPENDVELKRVTDLEKKIKMGAFYFFETEQTPETQEEDINVIIANSEKLKHNGSTQLTQLRNKYSDEELRRIEDPKFWEKYLGYVSTGENEIESNAARRRKHSHLKNLIEVKTPVEESIIKDDVQFCSWTTKTSQDFITHLTKFGWSRATSFTKKSKQMKEIELRIAGKVFIRGMMQSLDEGQNCFPLVTDFLKSGTVSSEESFIKCQSESFFSIIQQNAHARLAKIQTAEYIHLLVSTSNGEENIACTTSLPKMKYFKWDISMDRHLVFLSWREGFGAVKPHMLGMPGKQHEQNITERMRQIILAITKSFQDFQARNDTQLQFNNENVALALEQLTCQEHHTLISAILNVGFHDPQQVIEEANLNHHPDIVMKYVDRLIQDSRKLIEGQEVNQNSFVERLTLSQAYAMIQSIDILDEIHSIFHRNALQGEIFQIAQIVLEKGFSKALAVPQVLKFTNGENNIPKFQQKLLSAVGGQLPQPFIPQYQDFALYAKVFAMPLEEIPSNTNTSTDSNNENNQTTNQAPPLAPPPPINMNHMFLDNLPLHIGGSLIIVSLGNIVYDREAYHSDRYVYPVGYISERLFASQIDPHERVWYRSMILDGGSHPKFRVEMKDRPDIFYDGNVPSNPWQSVIRCVETKKRSLGMNTCRNISVSGPQYFGFAVSQVYKMIMQLPNIEKCKKIQKPLTLEDIIPLAHTKPNKVHKAQKQAKMIKKSFPQESEADKEDFDEDDDYVHIPKKPQDKKTNTQDKSHYVFSSDTEDDFIAPTHDSETVSTLTFNFSNLMKNPPLNEIHIMFPSFPTNILEVITKPIIT